MDSLEDGVLSVGQAAVQFRREESVERRDKDGIPQHSQSLRVGRDDSACTSILALVQSICETSQTCAQRHHAHS